MHTTLNDESGNPINDAQGTPITLDMRALDAMARKLNLGQAYTDMLEKELPADATRGVQLKRRQLWESLSRERMKLDRLKTELNPDAMKTFGWQARDNPATGPRGMQYIDALLESPDPDTRRSVDSHRIVAHPLVVGATTEAGGGGQTVRGVTVIGTSDPQASPAVVLYTPDAPDGIAYREFTDIGKVNALVQHPDWKRY